MVKTALDSFEYVISPVAGGEITKLGILELKRIKQEYLCIVCANFLYKYGNNRKY